ncbi:MAG: hypothetical protein CMJ86_11150 [Planctomycetes bacterium]|nr:hypothetical protein [Planctomycetota bacterium]
MACAQGEVHLGDLLGREGPAPERPVGFGGKSCALSVVKGAGKPHSVVSPFAVMNITRYFRPVLSVLALILFSSTARAQELAQLRFAGLVRGPEGVVSETQLGLPGMLVVKVKAMVRGEARNVELELFLAPNTSGQEVAGLVAARLSKAGFDVLQSGYSGKSATSTFIIVDALRVEVLVPNGLVASLASLSSAPAYFEVVAEREEKESFEIQLSCAFRLPVKRGIERVDFLVVLDGPAHGTQMAESISTQALKHGLRSERPNSVAWRPLRTVKSNTCLGFCASWRGRPGWGAVLGLADHR